MGLKYLWDTNAVIYYLQKSLNEAKLEFMNNNVIKYQPAISAITQIELLSWKVIKVEDQAILENFISDSIIFELEDKIKFKTVELRKGYNIKLPDAIIAATAIVMDLTLISNDRKGFSQINSLSRLSPF